MLGKPHILSLFPKVSKGAKIRNRYNQVPHLTTQLDGIYLDERMNMTSTLMQNSFFIQIDVVTDSVEVVLSRQNAVKCLLSAMRQYPKKTELLFQACKALIRQAQLSGKYNIIVQMCCLIRYLLNYTATNRVSRHLANVRCTLRDVSYNARWFWTTIRYGPVTTAYLCWTTGNGF